MHLINIRVKLPRILKSPNIDFDNFAVITTSPVAAKEQQSNKADIETTEQIQ